MLNEHFGSIQFHNTLPGVMVDGEGLEPSMFRMCRFTAYPGRRYGIPIQTSYSYVHRIIYDDELRHSATEMAEEILSVHNLLTYV